MTAQERQGWLIVATLFIVLLLVFGGGYNTVPVFVPALLRAFPLWTHKEVSILPSALAASAGLSVLPVGWLIDRIEARVIMVVGGLAAGAAFLIASQASGLAPMIGAYLLLGVGISAGTVLPASFVVANWFTARRGIAMGVANAGSTTGGMVMTLVAGYAIRGWGWRAAYMTVGLPMIAVAVPLILIVVRSRPPASVTESGSRVAVTLTGFDTGPALRTRSFWMIVIANFCFAFSATGTAIHMVAHLENVGFTSANAALLMSLIFGLAAVGKVLLGLLADRFSARLALAVDFAVQALGVALAFTLTHAVMAPIFVFVYGLSVAAPLMLLPLLLAESLGLRRFGLLAGLAGLAQTFGAMCGPLVSGAIFDSTKSYAGAFALFMSINLLGALVASACKPYSSALRSSGVLSATARI
jgi:OFA family oxalate/formate antiporter-like MFS transporter